MAAREAGPYLLQLLGVNQEPELRAVNPELMKARTFDVIRQMVLDPGFRQEDFTRLKTEAIDFLRVSLREGNDEELAAGLLLAEGVIRNVGDIGSIAVCRNPENVEERNVVTVYLRAGLDPDWDRRDAD